VYLSLILLAAALTPAPPAIAAPDTASRREVLAVLDSVMQAMATRDTALLARQFLPGARLVGMRPRDGGTVLQALTVPEFAAFMARDQRERWVERLHQPEVRIDNTLATVWARYDFHFGTRLSHCGTDSFQLLRTGDGWKILSLAAESRADGVVARLERHRCEKA
jgi:hypothetical protein